MPRPAAGARAPLPDRDGPARAAHGLESTRVRAAQSPLLEGHRAGDYVYFVHSYAAPVGDCTLATTHYGERFSAVVQRGNVYGAQFHPERSARVGALLLRNFLRLHEDDRLSMELIPAIDLQGRPLRAPAARATSQQRPCTPNDPQTVLERYRALGARRVHVVDLDGARDGEQPNRAVIVRARGTTPRRAAGRRRLADARSGFGDLLDAGVERAVIGSVAVTAPDEVMAWMTRGRSETDRARARRAHRRERRANAHDARLAARRATSRCGRRSSGSRRPDSRTCCAPMSHATAH